MVGLPGRMDWKGRISVETLPGGGGMVGTLDIAGGASPDPLDFPSSYPVPKEVGRVGTNSETYIQPVSERKDGIASMFKKQEAKKEVAGSPSSKTMDQKAKLKLEKRDEVHSPVKQEGKDVKGIEGLGDDSNAPQIKEEAKPTGADKKAKRKADPITEDVDAKRQSKRPKRVKVGSSDDEIEVVDKEEFQSKTRLVSQRESGRKSRGGAKMVEEKVDAAVGITGLYSLWFQADLTEPCRTTSIRLLWMDSSSTTHDISHTRQSRFHANHNLHRREHRFIGQPKWPQLNNRLNLSEEPNAVP
jgi:hypothetical protein